jgi:hypothetical protein
MIVYESLLSLNNPQFKLTDHFSFVIKSNLSNFDQVLEKYITIYKFK